MKILVASALLLSGLASGTQAQTALTYQKPPAAIEELLDAPLTPCGQALTGSVPCCWCSNCNRSRRIAEVAQPRYRLAGIRFNPATNGPSREVIDGEAVAAACCGRRTAADRGITRHAQGESSRRGRPIPSMLPSCKRRPTGLHLWVVDVAKASAHRVGSVKFNAVLGEPCEWLADSRAMLCKDRACGAGSRARHQ